jgi:protein ImuB
MQVPSAGPDNAPAAPGPYVVVAKINNTLQIVALDDAAARLGLEVGLPLANARAVCPQIAVVDADPEADRGMLDAIADWCDRFTPLVALDVPDGLFLDITGCAHLFGGEAALLHQLCAGVARQGFIVSAAIAGTAVCARALAHGRSGTIVPVGGEAAAVASLPVHALAVEDGVTRALHRAGLKTIGGVAARDSQEISARFGMAFTERLHQALGQSAAPISPRKPPADFTAEKRFAEPVATAAVIAATLAALAQILAPRMAQQGLGTRRLIASFFRADGAVRSICVLAGHPTRDAAMMARLFEERLDALADPLDPGFGFDLIRLAAYDTVLLDSVQQGFDTSLHAAEDVGRLVDRLAARLGSRRIVRYVPQDTHIPERVDLAVPAQRVAGLPEARHVTWPARVEGEPPLRPLRLFVRPERIEVMAEFPHGPPAGFRWRQNVHRLNHIEGPERIAMEWWLPCATLNHPEPDDAFLRLRPPQGEIDVTPIDVSVMTRDYFRAEDAEGLRYWIYREGIHLREVVTFRWFLHGMFA